MASPNAQEPSALHPVVEAASRGVLPPWTEAGEKRRAHMTRVSALMERWAVARKEPPWEIARWAAVGHLHDALRDANHDRLRELVDEPFKGLPGKILHGPGAARLLRDDGVDDGEFLHAVSFHTLGSGGFGTLGMALYCADFLEPGRQLREGWRGDLRRKAAKDLEKVTREILFARMQHLLDKGRPLHPETVGFWNRISEGQEWAGASEL